MIEAFDKVLEYSGDMHIFNIGSGNAHTLHEIIEIIEHKVGKKFVSIAYQPQRKCDVAKNVLAVEETQKALGWKAEMDLASGIENVIDYYVE